MAAEIADVLIPDLPEASEQSTIENMETDSQALRTAKHANRQA